MITLHADARVEIQNPGVEVDFTPPEAPRVAVRNPGVSVAVTPPADTRIAVLPARGPEGEPGKDGDVIGGVSDTVVADLILTPESATHGAVVEVVDDTTEPLVDLTILVENALT